MASLYQGKFNFSLYKSQINKSFIESLFLSSFQGHYCVHKKAVILS